MRSFPAHPQKWLRFLKKLFGRRCRRTRIGASGTSLDERINRILDLLDWQVQPGSGHEFRLIRSRTFQQVGVANSARFGGRIWLTMRAKWRYCWRFGIPGKEALLY